MHSLSHLRRALLIGIVASLVGASASFAGTADVTATYNASDAALVPFTLRGVTWRIATDASYPPDEWMSGTKIVGLDVSIMSAIATTLGAKYDESNVTFSAIIPGLKSGKYQIGNSSFIDTKSLESSVNLVDYFRAGEAVFANSGSTASFHSLADLCGLNVAVLANSPEQTTANEEGATCPSNAALSVHAFRTEADVEAAVENGAAQEALVDSQVAGYFVSTSKGHLELVGREYDVAPYGLATARTTTGEELALAIRAALRTLVANGTYDAILTQWGVTQGALPLRDIVIDGAKF
jgi:polar amino acid transport system substrate-binding protein